MRKRETTMNTLHSLACVGVAVVGVGVAACGGPAAQAPKAQVAEGAEAKANLGRQSCRARAPKGLLAPQSTDGATVVLAEQGERTLAVVADADERGVHLVDVDTGETLGSTPLDGTPSELTVLSDGRVVVALRDRSKLVVLEPEVTDRAMVERCRIDTPNEPVALAQAPGGDVVYALAGWGATLVGFDAEQLRPALTVELSREPRDVVVSEDGERAFVAHAVGGHLSVVRLADKEVTPVTTGERFDRDVEAAHERVQKALGKAGPLTAEQGDQRAKLAEVFAELEADIAKEGSHMRRTSCQSFALAKSTGTTSRVFAPQVLVDPGDASQRTAGYGHEHTITEMPSVAVLDPSGGHVLPPSLVVDPNHHLFGRDRQEESCLLPRTAAVHDASRSLLVGCFGTDIVVAYDVLSPGPVQAEKRRWRVASGPSGIAVDTVEARAVVWSQFDRMLNVIDLADMAPTNADLDPTVRKVEVASNPARQLSIELVLGRALFHATNDARIASDGRACASCHPDGRDDGLVWATPNGPRRTKLLAGTLVGTAPFGWDGAAHALEDHVRDTFKRLRGAGGLRSVELRALVAYLGSLPAPPKMAGNAKLVARGAEVFASEQAACASCHSGDAFTDNKVHDVQSVASGDRDKAFNTPTLLHLGARAPYFHDGRYKTLRDLLRGTDGTMGHTKHLSRADVDALEAFLKTL